jgi:hypothetical protein
MDGFLQQQLPIVRVDPYRAASLNRYVDGANRLTLLRTNDDYCDSIGRYEQALIPSDSRVAPVRSSASFA